MQENRFDSYMRELGGLTPAHEALLVGALRDIGLFQLKYMNSQEIIVPFSTVMSALAIYHKISVLKPGFRNVLELGPGCGYTALFFAVIGAWRTTARSRPASVLLLQKALLGTHPRVGLPGIRGRGR